MIMQSIGASLSPAIGGWIAQVWRKLADEAATLCPNLKVLFMTGFTKNAIVHNGVLDPGVHFLAKPFTSEELARKVREAIGTTTKT
jgi:FixJ family two-component response regulator